MQHHCFAMELLLQLRGFSHLLVIGLGELVLVGDGPKLQLRYNRHFWGHVMDSPCRSASTPQFRHQPHTILLLPTYPEQRD